jgi:haloalkane dehalogenase
MGNSGSAPDGGYRFFDHRRYLDTWFDALGISRNVILVVHDWGSVLGFDWAFRNQDRVKAIAYMEGIVCPFPSWDAWPALTRPFFQAQRSPQGEDIILEKNLFIEYMLPLRNIAPDAVDVYRRSGAIPVLSRLADAGLHRTRRIKESSADVENIENYEWLSSTLPKLFIDAEPGGFLIGAQREFCRTWPNQDIVTIEGYHFLQEEAPEAMAQAIARFVAKVLASPPLSN